jgi:hypothetical protein
VLASARTLGLGIAIRTPFAERTIQMAMEEVKENVRWIAGLTALMEAGTCFGRFVLDVQSTRDTGFVGRLTLGLRIHHGYVGLLLVFLSRRMSSKRSMHRVWGIRFGWALFASDMIHHFLVLWPVTGSPEFDLVYPRNVTIR